MSGGLPALTGNELIKLLKKDGWEEDGKRTHGLALKKPFPNGLIRSTVVKMSNDTIPNSTLGLILGPKQTNLGKPGLRKLIRLR
jgi:predicted RNA binding protein YcfA (HicA-like mRNA interferase family)